jgi:hypothetical protein
MRPISAHHGGTRQRSHHLLQLDRCEDAAQLAMANFIL